MSSLPVTPHPPYVLKVILNKLFFLNIINKMISTMQRDLEVNLVVLVINQINEEQEH